MNTDSPPLHDMVKGVSWLLGKWRSEEGKGYYPTIQSFTYGEEVEFTHVGQPNLQFSFYSWRAADKNPLHRELGFVRVKPNSNQVALIIAANIGVCEVEEGTYTDNHMQLESHTVGGLTFRKPPAVKKVRRTFTRNGDKLVQVLDMETENTPMTEHLRITYTKI
ncbi:peroxynitrite isomerase THAP4-like isoform X2 [Dreissena polymorpha]|uniref:peroxynitrite isomerase THAP4-like isoform X2 n=1 Tax=Dreissena polymorpha TaxID=45954 RepID=UPI00226546C9|nr:peroxynitrite isomerase THAP4-like isoform X2 [Dreissena polymorpha]